MDRPTTETASPRQPGLFERPQAPLQPRRPRVRQERPEDQRFDAMAYRQSSGIARERSADDELPVAASSSGAAVAGRTGRYLAAWIGLGLLSAGYLGGVVWQRLGAIDLALAPVTETLERLAIEIAEIRQTTAAIDARGRATAERVAAAETRLDGFAQTAANLPQAAGLPPAAQAQGQRPTNRAALEATPAPTQAKAPEPATTQRVIGIEVVQRPMPPTKQIVTVVTPAAPAVAPPAPVANVKTPTKTAPAQATAQPPTDAQQAQTSPINTGSVNPAAPTRPAGLLVASGPSLDSIRLSWNVLSQNHGNVLGSLEPRILPAGDGSAFQLIAGPFASDAEAQKACAALKARGVGCRPAEYAGAPL